MRMLNEAVGYKCRPQLRGPAGSMAGIMTHPGQFKTACQKEVMRLNNKLSMVFLPRQRGLYGTQDVLMLHSLQESEKGKGERVAAWKPCSLTVNAAEHLPKKTGDKWGTQGNEGPKGKKQKPAMWLLLQDARAAGEEYYGGTNREVSCSWFPCSSQYCAMGVKFSAFISMNTHFTGFQ